MKPIIDLVSAYPQLHALVPELERACARLIAVFNAGGKLLLCGNGGSCSDCEHVAGELLKGFEHRRPLPEQARLGLPAAVAEKLQWGFPCVPLPSITGYGSAWCNDVDPELVYAQLVNVLGTSADALACFSTSGNSKNVVRAAEVARARGMFVLAFTGERGGALSSIAQVSLRVPATLTAQVQELHLPLYHCLCRVIENARARSLGQ